MGDQWLGLFGAASAPSSALEEGIWSIFQSIYRFFTGRITTLSGTDVSLSTILGAVVIVIASLMLSKIIRRRLLEGLLERLGVEAGTRYSIHTIFHYTMIALGVFIALATVGVNMTALVAIFAFLSVGIGFGLQDLANNLVSGLVLLLERSIRVGDIVEVDGVQGVVEKISVRATEVKTFDSVSLLIPNSRFISQAVRNLTRGESRVRIHVQVGVAYGSDPKLVQALLLRAAADHPKTLKAPPPSVWLVNFGESALEYRLNVYVGHARDAGIVQSDLRFAIERLLRHNDLEIPLPQRVILLRGESEILPPGRRETPRLPPYAPALAGDAVTSPEEDQAMSFDVEPEVPSGEEKAGLATEARPAEENSDESGDTATPHFG